MATKSNNNGLTFSRKEMNAAAKGIAATIQKLKNRINNERRSMNAVIALIASSKDVEFSELKNWLFEGKKISQQTRKEAASFIRKNAPYICDTVTYNYSGFDDDDAVNVIRVNYNVPCNSKGRPSIDALVTVMDTYKHYQRNAAIRKAVAVKDWKTRSVSIEKNTYTDERKQNILNFIEHNAPEKYIQKHVGMIRVFEK